MVHPALKQYKHKPAVRAAILEYQRIAGDRELMQDVVTRGRMLKNAEYRVNEAVETEVDSTRC